MQVLLILLSLLLHSANGATDINTSAASISQALVAGVFLYPKSSGTIIQWDSKKGWLVKDSSSSATLEIHLVNSDSCAQHNQPSTDWYHVGFTVDKQLCKEPSTVHITDQQALATHGYVSIKHTFVEPGSYYVCTTSSHNSTWQHQGDSSKVRIQIDFDANKTIPLGAAIAIIIGCLLLSGLFSGLNLGLMSLDLTDLKIFQEAGSVKEKYYASTIYPLRKRGNFLLCSILLSNTLVNCAQTIVMDSIVHGIYATIMATLFIVIFGEIIPQAICSKHGLAIGAKTAFFTKIVMVITSPMSWPFGKCLDYTLGKQGPTAYNREKIRVLLREQLSDVAPEEMDIIAGVLALRDKTAEQHMRKLSDIFMVDAADMIDEKLYARICDSGYSRIPVYKEDRSNLIGVLHVKDLALVGSSRHRSVGTMCESFKLPFGICDANDGLFKLLRYILANNFHMILVKRQSNVSQTIGVITLEDIIEEMMHLEILDEFDADMEQKRNRFGMNKNIMSREKVTMAPQLKIGCMQVLSSLTPFKEAVSQDVLSRLIDQQYVEERGCQRKPLYEYGKVNDSFTILISGSATVEAGKEKLRFQVSHFATFGLSAVEAEAERRSGPFVPDYSVYLSGDVGYVRIPRTKWLAASRVTAFEKLDPCSTTDVQTIVSSLMTTGAAINTNVANTAAAPTPQSSMFTRSPDSGASTPIYALNDPKAGKPRTVSQNRLLSLTPQQSLISERHRIGSLETPTGQIQDLDTFKHAFTDKHKK